MSAKNIFLNILFVAALAVFFIFIRPFVNDTPVYTWIYEKIYWPARWIMKDILLNPVTYIAIFVILCLERFFPANKNQKIFSVGFAQDVVWFILDMFFRATIIAAISVFWKGIYKEHFSYLTIQAIYELPYWLRLTIAILMADFAGYMHHYLRHRVPFFWAMHAVHHSQKELNLFTDIRYHVLEYSITTVINVFFVLTFTDPYTAVAYGVFHSWWTKMCHANIKSNFGILKYILITPQSHRVHHSIELRHRDKNMGILFSIWDYMFGTQYRKYDEYPETGIDDHHFPHEKDANLWNLLIIMPIKQHLYPFQAYKRWWFKK